MLSNHKLVRGAVLAGLLAMVSACSLLTSSGADQCSTSGDCEALGFTGYTCGGGVCISPINVNPGVVTPQNALGCTSHDSCITANGGRPALCPNPGPQGACVNIAT